MRSRTLEELEDIEQNLLDEEEETGQRNYSMRIELYKEMYNRLKPLARRNYDVYKNYLENVQQVLVYDLIHYGTYLKTEYQKDDHLAASCLEDALKYDKHNPIAAYRLGFLSYKQKNYSSALLYFENALRFQRYDSNHKYQLNGQQQVNAHLYLTNSALYIAQESAKKLNQLSAKENLEISYDDIDPLYTKIFETEKYLQRNAFYNITKIDKTKCSKKACEKLVESQLPKTMILYFNDRTIVAVYEDKEAVLTGDQGNMLKQFILNSTEESPLTRAAFSITHNINLNTYIQSARRLRNKLIENGFPPMIQTTRYQDETAYYFEESYSYHVLYRVDEEIE
jgi:hypothetical protein